MMSFQDAFISYGRADSLQLAQKLNQRLVELGYDIWFDFDDIPQGVDYQKQIDAGIEQADNFIFIIAPHATNSPYCRKEVELAIALNKRLIPVMHVEEIDQTTWQQRNPNGTEAEWEAYKEQGLHSCFTNLHPELQKINWNQVSFKEGINDFEQSFHALVDILERQRDYVRQHTTLLNAALTWERQQKQSRYLLPTDHCQQVKAWLHTDFSGDQAPCHPTDLHCEFITESLEAAAGGLTQVFLAELPVDLLVRSPEAIATIEQIQCSLRREGFTVWSSDVNIKTGTDAEAAIRSGIEGADTIVYWLSPDTLQSSACQAQVNYALQLHKRVIPLVLEPVDSESLPVNQTSLHQIDVSQMLDDPIAQQQAIAQLLKALKEHASYHDQHKQILVRALKWDRQTRPKSLLLQGQEFTLADQWLTLANTAHGFQTDFPATDLQQIYIHASQEMNQFFDAFISYGRADSKAFAAQLHDQLADQGLNIWFDQNDIPLGVDFQEQINAGIEKSHNFIFVIAPHSVNSPYCLKEIELALELKKRIIPVLHVETISRDTWQQRNPRRTQKADWEAAQARGEDSSFANMHPEIGKINWVYSRETDDADAAFNGLLTLIRGHEDYVKLHTEILAKALAWERHQKQSQYLLVGTARTEAEAWLKTRFPNEQPPCFPADLHCEFITESTKNANNLMTQVFLSHAEEDQAIEEKVRKSLMRRGFTVWSSQRDLDTGADFETAIQQGIETADNLVYLMSPHSLQSAYCQREIQQALSLNKRIIPLRLTELAPEKLLEEVRSLQYIDLADNMVEADYHQDESDLVKILNQDNAYYSQHKMILAQALKWDRQQRNPSILLRRHNLRNAEAWLKVAEARSLHPATAIHRQFIQASVDLPEDPSLDVFISYSRKDSDVVRKLNDALQAQGKTTWFDQESIASGTDFQAEIYQGIETSDNFLFVISPNSVNSPYCAGEVEHAAKLGKRFISVLHQPVAATSLHPELAKVQWIDFNNHEGDFYANFSELVRTLDTDREHVRSHTKWSQRALEWLDKKRSRDLLLRGNEFAIADEWLNLSLALKKRPAPTDRQREFLQASREAMAAATRKEKRQKIRLQVLSGVMTVVAMVATGLGIWAISSKQEVTRAKIRWLNTSSESQLAAEREFEALLLGLQTAQILDKDRFITQKQRSQLKDDINNTLRQSLYNVVERDRFSDSDGMVKTAQLSPNGEMMAIAHNNSVGIFEVDSSNVTKFMDIQDDEFVHLQFGHDSQTIATFTMDYSLNDPEPQPIKLWDLEGHEINMIGEEDGFEWVQFAPDHKTIATFDGELVQFWNFDGKLLASLEEAKYELWDVFFSEDGQTFAGINSDSLKVSLWQRDGTPISTFTLKAEDFSVTALSPDGQMMVMSNGEIVQLRNQNGDVITTLQDTDWSPSKFGIAFHPTAPILAIAAHSKQSQQSHAIQIWQTDGTLLTTLTGHEQEIISISFSPDGELMATGSFDNQIKIWDQDWNLRKTLTGHNDWVHSVKFSPDSQQLISGSSDGTVRVWDRSSVFQQEIDSTQAIFNEDQQTFVTTTENGAVKRHAMEMGNAQGTPLLPEAGGDIWMDLSENGETLLITRNDAESWQREDSEWYGPVQLWQNEHQAAITLIDRKTAGPDTHYVDAAMSRDGSSIVTTLLGPESYGPVQLWDSDGNLIKTLMEDIPVSKDNFWPGSVQISDDGQMIVTTLKSSDFYGPVQLWDRKGQLVSTLMDRIDRPEEAKGEDEDEGWIRGSVRLSQNGKSLVTILEDSTSYGPVQLWSPDGTLISTLIHKAGISEEKQRWSYQVSSQVSDDGQTILTTLNPDESSTLIQLWDGMGNSIKTLVDQSDLNQPGEAFFSEDYQHIITIIPNQAVQLWKTDGTPITTIHPNIDEEDVESVFPILSPDDGLMAIPVNSREVEIWNMETGEQETTIVTTEDRPSAFGYISRFRAVFSPDSQILAVAGPDNTIRLWDRASNTISALNGHNSEIFELYFDQESRILASSDEHSVRLYQLEGMTEWDDLIEKGCNRMKAYLNRDQRPEVEDVRKFCNSK